MGSQGAKNGATSSAGGSPDSSPVVVHPNFSLDWAEDDGWFQKREEDDDDEDDNQTEEVVGGEEEEDEDGKKEEEEKVKEVKTTVVTDAVSDDEEEEKEKKLKEAALKSNVKVSLHLYTDAHDTLTSLPLSWISACLPRKVTILWKP